MAISTSQKIQFSKAASVLGDVKQEQPLLNGLLQKVVLISQYGKSRSITDKDKIFLFSQLALLLEAGTPLNRSLVAIKTQIENPFFRDVIEGINKEIEDGKPLSEAMEKYKKEFSETTISMIRAGEISGSLDSMLTQAEDFEKKKEAFRSMVKRALTYPLFLMMLSLGVVIFVLTYIFPKFATLFSDIWEILPVSTKLLMVISSFLRESWYAVLMGLGVIVVFCWKVLQREAVRNNIDRFKMKLPIIGKLFIMIYTAQMLRTLGFLIQGSVPLLEALTITRGTIRNMLYHAFIDKIVATAKGGKPVSYAFSQSDFMPETVKQVIKTGEDSGRLDFVMVRLAEYYDNEIEKQVKLLSTIIEPLALIIMGVVVGFIVLSIVLPIFKLSRAVH